MSEKILKPQIRFKGFTEPWEQRKLKDLVTYRRGSFPQPYGLPQWYGGNGSMPFVQVADVGEDLKLKEETNQTISKIAQPSSVFVKKGSVIVTLQGTIGRVAFTHYDAYLDRTILVFDSYKENLDKYFWCLTIRNKFIDEAKRAPGGIIKTITKEALSDFDLNIPTEHEQEKIGFLLNRINKLITLHQRKYDGLVKMKKALLQKMFPKSSTNIPEIRFKGFADPWEQRKLSEFCSFLRGQGLSWNDVLDDGKYPCLLYGQIYTDYGMIIETVLSKTNRREPSFVLSKHGDVLVPGSDTTPNGIARATSIEVDDVILGGDINIIRPEDINGNYLSLSLNANRKKMLPLITGTTVRHLHNSVLKDIELYVSLLGDEQEKIVKLFKLIDKDITLHQRKCEKLINLKKSLLDRMFC